MVPRLVAACRIKKGVKAMLVLSRRNQQSVVIGDPDDAHGLVIVTVIEVQGGKVKLGFEAPGSISILRSEVWDRDHAARQPKNLASSRDEPTNRWEDDGGIAGVQAESCAVPVALGRAAGAHKAE
jgi:carbon storage regulator CsrA